MNVVVAEVVGMVVAGVRIVGMMDAVLMMVMITITLLLNLVLLSLIFLLTLVVLIRAFILVLNVMPMQRGMDEVQELKGAEAKAIGAQPPCSGVAPLGLCIDRAFAITGLLDPQPV